MARPRKKIDVETLKKLAAIQCSYAEMAAILGVNESTLTRRFAQVIKEGREHGKSSLKRKQYEVAMGGNTTMLIWLGKQHLEQRDKNSHEHSGPDGKPIETRDVPATDAALEARVKELINKLGIQGQEPKE
jgi:AraC-like DNA-binding protein